MKKAAAYSGTRNLYPMMVTSAKSLLMHSDVDTIYFFIEDNEFPFELPDCIKCINVKYQKFLRPDGANMRSSFTYMAMIRVAYCYFFPDLDRILSLDADTIIDRDISDMWEFPIDDCYFAGAKEPGFSKHYGILYVNAGVALYNLKKMRDGKAGEVITLLNNNEYQCMDQDPLNLSCQGHIYEFPPEYNQTRFTAMVDNPRIIHYAGYKNWTEFSEYKKYEAVTMEEAMAAHGKNIPSNRARYMIHTYPGRKWYVDGYLIPSMLEQGILKKQITVWNDEEGLGNLGACMKSFLSLDGDDGTWHLQDDVVISETFAERTEKYNDGIVCGFANVSFDGKVVGNAGAVPIDYGWFSFQCNRFPDKYVHQCAEWYYNEVIPKNLYPEFTKDGKCDDSIWQRFAYKHLQHMLVLNLAPNLVDHVDYLLGGSVINKQRLGARRSYYWNESETIVKLEKWLSERNE